MFVYNARGYNAVENKVGRIDRIQNFNSEDDYILVKKVKLTKNMEKYIFGFSFLQYFYNLLFVYFFLVYRVFNPHPYCDFFNVIYLYML